MRRSIFHQDWWLDALAPGCWREVTCIRGGHIAGALRFVERSEAGMKICVMPHITRILGPVVTAEANKTETRTRFTHSVITELLHQIAGHHHVEMVLDTGFTDLSPFLHAGYAVNVHPTFLLNCNRRVEDLWAGLRDKARNAVRRARERLMVRDIDDVNLFVRFYENNLVDTPYFDLSLLTPVLASARGRQQCKIIAATDDGGADHAMAAFIWDDERVYYFLSSRRRDAAHFGAVSLLLWGGIELAHSRSLCLDFDGGLTSGSRYKFLLSFGGTLANRFEVARSTSLYRFQNTIRRIPRAAFRRLSRLSGRIALTSVFLHLSICCGRAGRLLEVGEFALCAG